MEEGGGGIFFPPKSLGNQRCSASFLPSINIYNWFNGGTGINSTVALFHIHISFAYIMRVYVASIMLGIRFAEISRYNSYPPTLHSVRFAENSDFTPLWVPGFRRLSPSSSHGAELITSWEMSGTGHWLYSEKAYILVVVTIITTTNTAFFNSIFHIYQAFYRHYCLILSITLKESNYYPHFTDEQIES